MPIAPLKQCTYPGCRNLTAAGRCESHRRQTRKEADDRRTPSRQRGYDTTWAKVQALYSRQHPLCEDCLEKGVERPRDMVHHKVPINAGGAVYDFENLRSLCWQCHGKY